MAIYRATYTTASSSLSFNLEADDEAAALAVAQGYISGPDSRPIIELVDDGGGGNSGGGGGSVNAPHPVPIVLASINSADVTAIDIEDAPDGAHAYAAHLEDDRLRLALR